MHCGQSFLSSGYKFLRSFVHRNAGFFSNSLAGPRGRNLCSKISYSNIPLFDSADTSDCPRQQKEMERKTVKIEELGQSFELKLETELHIIHVCMSKTFSDEFFQIKTEAHHSIWGKEIKKRYFMKNLFLRRTRNSF